jgi:hypothetical protein
MRPRLNVQPPIRSLTVGAQFRRGAAMRKHADISEIWRQENK